MVGLGQLSLFIGFVLLFLLEISKASKRWDPNGDGSDLNSSTESPQMQNDSAAPPTTQSLFASDEKLFLVQFNWNRGTEWKKELADTDSEEFINIAKDLENSLGKLVFNNKPKILAWNVLKLENNSFALKVSLNVQTTMNMSAERLVDMLQPIRIMMRISEIVGEELYLRETSILPESTGSFLATLSVSVSLQTPPPTSVAPTVRTTSPVSTTPHWNETPFSNKTATESSSISPSISEEFEASSAKDDSTERVPTKRSTIKTKPTIPADTMKFVVSMTVDSYSYTPAMADPESSVFKKVASEIEDDLFEELCVKKLPCIGVKVFKLAKGSVIVSYNVHMASSTKYKRSDVQNVISDAAKDGELGRLKVRNVVVEKEKEEEDSSSSSSSVFIYVLCGVGAFLVIAVVIVAVSKYRGYRKNSQVHGTPSNSGEQGR